MGQFKPMPKMETTEPSVELKLKKGGKVKKMMDGGVPMVGAAPTMRRGAVMPRGVSPLARAGMPMRAKGGSVGNEKAELRRVKAEIAEDRREEKNEHEEIGRVKGELKRHESMKASKAHKGYKNGGAPKAGPNVVGGLAGGLSATRPDGKKTTGGVRAPGYKNGGALNAKGMALAKKYETKMNDGSSPKQRLGKSGGVSDTTAGGRPAGYKKGGAIAAKGMAIANKYQTKMNSGNPMPTVKGSTKGVKVGAAGYKSGGHVAMTCKAEGGFTAMKKMAKC